MRKENEYEREFKRQITESYEYLKRKRENNE